MGTGQVDYLIYLINHDEHSFIRFVHSHKMTAS